MVEQADIQISILPNLLGCKKTERTNAVVEVYEHDVGLRFSYNISPIVIIVTVLRIATALDIDPDRKSRDRRGVRWGKDIDK